MVHVDGHELAILGSYTGMVGIVHGIYGKGWLKAFIHRQPIMAFSVALGTVGVFMPIFVVPIRRRLGLPTNQYDAFFPGTVFPKMKE